MSRATSGLVLLSGLLAGCAVGPDFSRPDIRTGDRYTAAQLPAQLVADQSAANPAQRLRPDGDIPGEWWNLFHSQQLNALLVRALARNPDLDAAQAALTQARENVYAQEGSFFPSISASFTPSRNKTPTAALSAASASGNPYYSLHTAQLTVSYSPDVFGLNRRQVESYVALAQVQRYQLEATYLTLTSNLVVAAITEASIRGQIAATQEIVAVERGLLNILNKQQELGQVARLDVLAQEAAAYQAESTLPPLLKQLAQQRDLIAALSGGLPSEAISEEFTLDTLRLPDEVPVSLPSRLVEQRPDVKQAEANLHSASALIGVAVANRLPLLSLTAQGGSQANFFNALFTPGTGFWTIAASVAQPLFEGGTLLHRERFARAAFDQAAAQYQSTVISAFQNVADALNALQADAETVRVAALAARTATATLDIAREQLRLGQVSYLTQLNAQQTALQARLTLVQGRASRLADTAALFQALGGGWWNRTDVKVLDVTGDDLTAILGLHQ